MFDFRTIGSYFLEQRLVGCPVFFHAYHSWAHDHCFFSTTSGLLLQMSVCSNDYIKVSRVKCHINTEWWIWTLLIAAEFPDVLDLLIWEQYDDRWIFINCNRLDKGHFFFQLRAQQCRCGVRLAGFLVFGLYMYIFTNTIPISINVGKDLGKCQFSCLQAWWRPRHRLADTSTTLFLESPPPESAKPVVSKPYHSRRVCKRCHKPVKQGHQNTKPIQKTQGPEDKPHWTLNFVESNTGLLWTLKWIM